LFRVRVCVSLCVDVSVKIAPSPNVKLNEKKMWMCIAPTQPFRTALEALKAECVTRVTRQTGKLNERSRTTTSRSQQQIRTESYSLPSLIFESVIFGMLKRTSLTTRPSPIPSNNWLLLKQTMGKHGYLPLNCQFIFPDPQRVYFTCRGIEGVNSDDKSY
jgi:hypothetical protein